MANTLNAALLIDVLSMRAQSFLPHVLAPLNAFCRDFSEEEMVPTKAVQVPLVTAGSTTLTNPEDFEAGDSTVGKISVTVNHYSQPFHVSQKEFASKMRLEQLAEGNLNALAESLAAVVTALMTTGNFTGTAETVAQASFAAANAKSLWGKLGKSREKVLLLDSVAYAQLAPTDKNAFALGETGAYGFNRIFQQTIWTGATANTYGFAAGREAIAMAAGIPPQVPGLGSVLLEQELVEIPQLGLTVQVNVWVSAKTRALWCSYDLMFGAAVGIATAGIIVKSA